MGMAGILRVVPDVQFAFAWNAENRTWEFATRNGYTNDGWLKPGMHLFLWIEGEEAVKWQPKPYVAPELHFDEGLSEADG